MASEGLPQLEAIRALVPRLTRSAVVHVDMGAQRYTLGEDH